MVHPYYSPVGASARAGVVSMAAYLVFWAVVVTVAGRELQRRFPRGAALGAPARDSALTVLGIGTRAERLTVRSSCRWSRICASRLSGMFR